MVRQFGTAMKYLIPIVAVLLLVLVFLALRTPPAPPAADPSSPAPAVEPSVQAPPSVLPPPPVASPTVPPAEVTPPVELQPAPAPSTPPQTTTPPPPAGPFQAESVPEPGQLDIAALFTAKILDRVRTETAKNTNLHYGDYLATLDARGDDLGNLLLQRRVAMVEAGIAAQLAGQQPDPAVIADAYGRTEAQIQQLLGDDYAAFADHELGLQDRMEVDTVTAVMGSDDIPLSEDQRSRFHDLLRTERQAANLAFRWDSPDAMSILGGNVPDLLTRHHDMYAKVLEGAAEFLSQRQSDQLRNIFEQRLESMTQAINAVPRQPAP
jgi:hypothetical protein